jgi:class II lanthipeptide synthase
VSAQLEVAAAIGRRLADEAIWHEDRCNWIGAAAEPGPAGVPSVVYGSLGADLYSGTAGVALVLAEIAAAGGEASARRTALGAIRQALRRTESMPAEVGLYTGALGVAWAATRVSAALGEPEPAERAAEIPARVGVDRPSDVSDLIAGHAGGILALLALADLERDQTLLARAADLGGGLLEAARRRNGTLSWASPGIPAREHLTGLSHGASGPGLALLELHGATGEAEFRDAGLAAFAYERDLFHPTAGNWADLRTLEPSVDGAEGPFFMTAWCHGAPGIGLARLRAVELLGDPVCRSEAEIAAATTEAALGDALTSTPCDLSPCHGLSGLAEVLLHADRVLGGDRDGGRRLALALAEAGVERYADPGRPWPCGVPEGETPGLMIGLAGIALFYLRLHDPTVPSALWLRPATVAC